MHTLRSHFLSVFPVCVCVRVSICMHTSSCTYNKAQEIPSESTSIPPQLNSYPRKPFSQYSSYMCVYTCIYMDIFCIYVKSSTHPIKIHIRMHVCILCVRKSSTYPIKIHIYATPTKCVMHEVVFSILFLYVCIHVCIYLVRTHVGAH
jgi:hypothetical protein